MLRGFLVVALLGAPAPVTEDKSWNLAGIWVFDRGGPAAVVTLRVQGDGTVGANLLGADLQRVDAIGEATRVDGKLVIVGFANYDAYQAKRPAWKWVLGEPGDRVLKGLVSRGGDPARPLALRRWKADAIHVLPAEAVAKARARWEQDGRKMDAAGVSVSEMADEEVTGRPGRREWWVHIPQGRSNVMPAELTISIDVATGAARGPFGR